MVVGVAVGLLAILVLLLIILIRKRREQKRRIQEREAAAILLKQKQLDEAIDMNYRQSVGTDQLILVITWKDDQKRKFVFDPSSGVKIGRGIDSNQICVPLETVSYEHCIIFSNGDNLYIKDLNSANGTFNKRGFKIYRVRDSAPCYDNDVVIVGDVRFKISSFYMNSKYIS